MTPHCTCHIKGDFPSCNKHTTFKETKTDEDGICLKCGHHCIYTSKYEIFPRPKLGGNGKGYIHGYRPIYINKVTWTRKKHPRELRKYL